MLTSTSSETKLPSLSVLNDLYATFNTEQECQLSEAKRTGLYNTFKLAAKQAWGNRIPTPYDVDRFFLYVVEYAKPATISPHSWRWLKQRHRRGRQLDVARMGRIAVVSIDLVPADFNVIIFKNGKIEWLTAVDPFPPDKEEMKNIWCYGRFGYVLYGSKVAREGGVCHPRFIGRNGKRHIKTIGA